MSIALPPIWIPRRSRIRIPTLREILWASGGLLRDPTTGAVRRNPSTGGVYRDPGGGCTGCGCSAPTYIQAKKCSDNSNADLWFDLSTVTLPKYFLLGGVNYYVDSGCNTSSTPGTLASGYTNATSCPNSCGGLCVGSGSRVPTSWDLVGSTSVCTGCVHIGASGGGNSGCYQISGSIPSTFTVDLASTSSTCPDYWYFSDSGGPTVTGYDCDFIGGTCAGSGIFIGDGIAIHFALQDATTAFLIVNIGANSALPAWSSGLNAFAGFGTRASNDCESAITFPTNLCICPNSPGATDNGSTDLGFGGSWTATPRFS